MRSGISTRGIRRSPRLARAFEARAAAHRAKKEYDLALQDYGSGRLPESAVVRPFCESRQWQRSRNNKKAVEDSGQAIQLDPQDSIAWNNRCWNRAILGELDTALDDCNQSLAMDANDLYTLDSRGFVYLKLKHTNKAVADYRAALAIDAKMPTSLYGLGLAEQREAIAVPLTNTSSRLRSSDLTLPTNLRSGEYPERPIPSSSKTP